MKDSKRTNRATTSPKDARRRRRTRPVPAWLMKHKDLDEIARRRCLLVLSVLSGEKAVSDAIEQVQISRPLYYDLENRALRAMLQALTPQGPAAAQPGAVTAAQRIAELESKVARLERDKRRAERLLLLTRHVVKPGPLTTGAGRPAKGARRKSSRCGSKHSETSTKQTPRSVPSSIPMEAGGGEP